MPTNVQQNIASDIKNVNAPKITTPTIASTTPITIDTQPEEFQPKEIDFMKQAKAQ